MNDKTLRVLEYNKIKEMLSEHATSKLGKERVLEITPSIHIEEVRQLQTETTEGLNIIIQNGNVPTGKIIDLRHQMKLADIGSFLQPRELLNVADSLRTARILKKFISNGAAKEDRYPNLCELAEAITPHKEIESRIEISIINDTEISDHASHDLKKIRRSMDSKNAAIRNKLDSIITSQSNQKYLRDSLITIRQDRFVIPVKAEHKNSIKGLIHDQSAKGSTFYIEPIAVVELNNELRELMIAEKKEIEKILLEITEEVAEVKDDILMNQECLVSLDFIFAKAKFSLKMDGISPKLRSDGRFNIKKGRHPLLPKDEVVPTNIWIGENFTTLLVTGPNTGGKTVTLKTVGLLTLMAQSGMHVPAGSSTSIAVFDSVYADIGDEQSIEQSLSTFSSHMTNIVDILKEVNSNSLVLFDELGAGTDPTEGAALAMAILNKLFDRRIRTIATTHYSELKEFAIVTEGVENASMEFNIETLSPTYKLLIGIPGKSNAFDISSKLGLESDIIANARELIHRDDIEFEDILTNIEKSRKEAEDDRDKSISLKLEMEKKMKRLDEKEAKLNRQKDTVVKDAKAEARAILKKAKEESDEIIRSLQGLKTKEEKEKNKQIEAARKKLKENLKDVTESYLDETVVNSKAPTKLKKGDKVKVLSLNQVGTVLSKIDASGHVQIQVGIMKVKMNVKNLVKTKENKDDNKTVNNARSMARSKSMTVTTEIDVRGNNVEGAIVILDKYIDDVSMSNLESVRIIHGKGTGALRKGLQQYFKYHPHIKSYRYGEFNEGGDGVTVITVK